MVAGRCLGGEIAVRACRWYGAYGRHLTIEREDEVSATYALTWLRNMVPSLA